jgi:hypothetical protein
MTRYSAAQFAGRKPYPDRITSALDRAGLFGDDPRLGDLAPLVDGWEDGTVTPTFDQVERLAALTGVTPRFFYVPVPPLVGWMCGSRGCQRIDTRPSAPVIPLHAGTLW